MKKLFFILFLFIQNYLLVAQAIDRKNLLIENFGNSAKAEPYLIKLWEETLRAQLINLHQSIFVVDRIAYDLIKKERIKEKQNVAGVNRQGVTLGAEYLITGDVKAVKTSHKRYLAKTEKYTPEPTKENPNPKELVREIYAIKCVALVTVQIKMVNIESSEIKHDAETSQQFDISIEDTKENSLIKKGETKAIVEVLKHIPHFIKPELIFQLNPKYYILEVTKGDNKPKKILLTGGSRAGFPNFGEVYLNVFESVEENIDGQKLTREILIGNIKAEDIYEEVTEAIVVKGSEVIGEKIRKGATLFCKFEKIPVPGEFY